MNANYAFKCILDNLPPLSFYLNQGVSSQTFNYVRGFLSASYIFDVFTDSQYKLVLSFFDSLDVRYV